MACKRLVTDNVVENERTKPFDEKHKSRNPTHDKVAGRAISPIHGTLDTHCNGMQIMKRGKSLIEGAFFDRPSPTEDSGR